MFTLIENYKRLFMSAIISYFEEPVVSAMEKVYNDPDGWLNKSDLNGLKMSSEERAAILELIAQKDPKLAENISRGKVRAQIESLIANGYLPERRDIVSGTVDAQRAHRADVETATEGLTGAKLQSAVKYIERKDEKNMDNLAKWLLGRSAHSTEELAQAVYDFQKEHSLTTDGKPGTGTTGKLNALIESGDHEMPRLTAKERREIRRAEREAEAAAENNEVFLFGIEGLQQLIGTPVDGNFGPASRKALKAYIARGENETKEVQKLIGTPADGDFGRNSRRALEKFLSTGGRPANQSELGAEVVEDLKTIERYLNAYNDTYGERGRLMSNKMGILGLAQQVSDSDANALARELGISQGEVKKFGKELGIATGPNVMPGLKRFAVIAALSLITTGGAAVAIEIFGINVGTKLSEGPEARKILELMGRNGNIDHKMRTMLLSRRTTVGDISATFDVLNNEAMIPNNLKRNINRIFGRSFLNDIFGETKDQREVGALVDKFEAAQTVEQGQEILVDIYELCLEKIRDKRTRNSNELSSRMQKLEAHLAEIGVEASRITALHAKKDQILGVNRGAERRAATAEIEASLGQRTVNSIPKSRLESSEAYSLALPKPPTREAMQQRLALIKHTRIEGDKNSMMAHIMRGIQEHYGISFNESEFSRAFVKMRAVTEKEAASLETRILSNTGRKLSQSFQGEVKNGNITVMKLNGTNVYFRSECANVLTVADALRTTVEGRTSIPVGIAATGLNGSEAGVGTRPIIDDPIPLDDITVGTVPGL